MARGFGAMQRAILDALREMRAEDTGLWAPWPPVAQDPVFQDNHGTLYNPVLVYRVGRLCLAVAHQRGGVAVVTGQVHQVSIVLNVCTAQFKRSFSRALRGLIARHELVPVQYWVPGAERPQWRDALPLHGHRTLVAYVVKS